MKNANTIQIDLEAARHCELEETGIIEIMKQKCFKGRDRMSIQELLDSTTVLSVLPLLRFACVPDAALYCRSVAVALAKGALEENRAYIDRYHTYSEILNNLHNYTPEQLKQYFTMLKDIALDSNDADRTGLIETINSCAAGLVCETIALIDYEEITDLNECALELPRNALMNWVELSTQCDPTLNALNNICMDAQRAEQQWRSGTDLHFDFMSDKILAAYPAAYRATHGLTSDCTEHSAEQVLLTVSMQG